MEFIGKNESIEMFYVVNTLESYMSLLNVVFVNTL